jgi:hypothetical protein
MMAFSSISSLASPEKAAEFFKTMNMPAYLISFLSIAKILGVIAILVPGYPRIKEWAYAGLTFDLIGAVYCNYAVGKPASDWLPMVIFIVLALVSYYLYHKLRAPQIR